MGEVTSQSHDDMPAQTKEQRPDLVSRRQGDTDPPTPARAMPPGPVNGRAQPTGDVAALDAHLDRHSLSSPENTHGKWTSSPPPVTRTTVTLRTVREDGGSRWV